METLSALARLSYLYGCPHGRPAVPSVGSAASAEGVATLPASAAGEELLSRLSTTLSFTLLLFGSKANLLLDLVRNLPAS